MVAEHRADLASAVNRLALQVHQQIQHTNAPRSAVPTS
jgi:hypothetical protein